MPTIGLPTFLFNDAADSLSKARRMAKYANEPGGGQYYWGVAEGARKLFGDDLPYDAAVGVMENMKIGHQRTANQNSLYALYQWKRNIQAPHCFPQRVLYTLLSINFPYFCVQRLLGNARDASGLSYFGTIAMSG